MRLIITLLIIISSFTISEAQTHPPLDTILKGMEFRNIGPFRGGRSVASSGVPGQPMTYYMGSTGGGIWKTEDAGINWKNISDGQLNTGSVGAIAVAPSAPNIIYVGMGEHAIRGVMTSHGDGVYVSKNAGKTWEHLGLEDSRHISEVIVHPSNAEVVYVAVQGAAYGSNEERGVYKTVDGGKTWTQVFYLNEDTGAADLTMNPTNPNHLFVSMWNHRRFPWYVQSGGEGSGIYQSKDGGETWKEVKKGLPKELGKSAIDISKANPNVVYANIEAEGEKGGVYRSDDGGQSWRQTSSDRVTVARAWYYIEVFADPQDEDIVYVLNAPMLRSVDGGKSFKPVSNPHGDQHHLWINPENNQNMILSNDGGACVSFNAGRSWSSQQNQPTIQFYRVITDNLFPYNVYGGQQDNSSIITPSRTTGSGITWKDWFNGPGCESAFMAFDPDQPDLIFGGCYQGIISVMDRETKVEKSIMAYPTIGLGWTPSDMKYRFNWNAPIVASPQDPNVIYHCGNKVLKTTDGGMSWQEISPDLTRNDISKQGVGGGPFTNEGAGGEVYNTIAYMAASTHDANVLWTGSDCGLVHVTRDGGQNWTNVTPEGLGESLINTIDISPHSPGTAYLSVTKYKFNDFTPIIYKTTDYGESWNKIVRGINEQTFVRVVREDVKRKDLLYAGTELGLYLSFNGGMDWERCQLNLPICPINDLTFRDNDLVIATAGRSFWILDDLGAIQTLPDANLEGAQLITPKPTYRVSAGGRSRPGTLMGSNPLSGVIIDYYLSDVTDSTKVSLKILDQSGTVLRSYTNDAPKKTKPYPGGPPRVKKLPAEIGVNRFNWNLRKENMPAVDGVFLLGSYSGPMVPPGKYTIQLDVDDQSLKTDFDLISDPRIEASREAFVQQYDKLQELEKMFYSIHESVNSFVASKKQLAALADVLRDNKVAEQVVALGDSLIQDIDLWESNLIQREQKTFQDVINFPNKLNAEVASLMSEISGPQPELTKGVLNRLNDIEGQYAQALEAKDKVREAIKKFNKAFKEANLDVIAIPE